MGLIHLFLDVAFDGFHVFCALCTGLGHQILNPATFLRLKIFKGGFFKLIFYPVITKSRGNGRINVESFPSNFFPFIPFVEFEGAHIVKPVGQLDQNNPDIIGHGQKHLAKALGLSRPGAVKRKTAEFGDAGDDVPNFGAEQFFDFLRGRLGVLNHIVQETGCNTDDIQFHVTDYSSHFQWMRKIGLAGKAHLACMHPGGIDVGTLNDIQIRLRMVLTNFIYDIVNSNQIWSLVAGSWLLVTVTGCQLMVLE